MAQAARRPATTAGTAPVASRTTMPSSTAMACFAPAPMGTAWRRISSGESTTSTLGSPRCSSSAFHVPWSSSVSPAASAVSFGP